MKVLIVDDSNVIRARIARIVSDGTLPSVNIVGSARNGSEALRVARAARPEVVTMDLTMPDSDGLQTIPRLVAALPEVHILVVSALNDKSTALRALRLGARGFLHKPFSDAQLKEALLELVNGR
jgi:two-component system, chemotaxis family, chemotaxis protein CheY